MPLLLSQNRKMFIAVTTTALLVFSIMMLAFQDHDEVSFSTQASVLHSSAEQHDTAAANTAHEDF